MVRVSRSRNKLIRLAVAGLIFCLSGCANKPSPGYFFEWVQPPDSAGRSCVAACSSEKWQCGARSIDRAEMCATEQQAKAEECEYQEIAQLESCFASLQIRFGELWEEFASTCDTGPTHCAMPSCGDGDDCEARYEHCFIECGGDIIEHGADLQRHNN